MTEQPDDVILRPQEAARRLGVSRSTLYVWQKHRDDFPRRIVLGPRVSGWRWRELKTWLDRQAQRGGVA